MERGIYRIMACTEAAHFVHRNPEVPINGAEETPPPFTTPSDNKLHPWASTAPGTGPVRGGALPHLHRPGLEQPPPHSYFSQVYKATRSTYKDTLRPQRLPAEHRSSSKPPSPGNHQLVPNSPPAIFLTANSHEQKKDIKMHHYYMHYNIICVTLSRSPSIICAGHTWV